MSLLEDLTRPKLPVSLRENIRRWQADPMAFRREMIVLEDGQRLGEAIEPWQTEDFVALDGPTRNAYWERARGHDKTGGAGTEAVKELIIGARDQRMYAAAADEDQSRILLDDVVGKLRRNPLLLPLVDIRGKEIRSRLTGSRLVVLSSDVPSSWGLRPDWVVLDEIAQWPERAREFWNSIYTATGKRPNCRLLVISTPGWNKASLAWEVHGIAEREATWHLSVRGSCAGWISPAWLAQQRRSLPPHVFARLHEARWVDGVGAFLTAAEVDAIFTGTTHGDGKTALGLDIGLTRDRTVVAVARNVAGTVAVLHLVTFAGAPGRKVDLDQVEDEVKALASRYCASVHYDPYQGVQMGQRLQRSGISAKEYAFTGESRRKLFSLILDLVRTGRLRAAPHPALRTELLGLEATESAAGWRVDHRVGQHDDHVVAVALAAQAVAGQPVEIRPEHFFCDTLADRARAVEAWVAKAEARASAESCYWYGDE